VHCSRCHTVSYASGWAAEGRSIGNALEEPGTLLTDAAQLILKHLKDVWIGAKLNYGPNLGYDYGGRLLAAWLDR